MPKTRILIAMETHLDFDPADLDGDDWEKKLRILADDIQDGTVEIRGYSRMVLEAGGTKIQVEIE